MRSRAFAITKEELAAAVPSTAQAAGGAMCAKVYQIPKDKGGRDLEAAEAHRIVSQVSLGKRSILFRGGNHAERALAIEELGEMLKRSKTKGGRVRLPFDFRICNCIAATALEELREDMCSECRGSGVVRDHELEGLEGKQPMKTCPVCMGIRRRRYNEDERVSRLAVEWIAAFGFGQLRADSLVVGNGIRKHRKFQDLLAAVDFAKGMLIECERAATEETARMLERW